MTLASVVTPETILELRELIKHPLTDDDRERCEVLLESLRGDRLVIGHGPYTRSVDAAIGLVNALGWSMRVIHFGPRGDGEATIGRPNNVSVRHTAVGRTAALAICGAVIKSLRPRGGTKTKEMAAETVA